MCLSDLISVIIPVYNVEKFLMRCYKSIADQTYSKLEIILIDDGSVDNSGKICDEIAENDLRVKVIHKKNEGLGLARNTGLDMASGDYVVFVDSDDFVKKNYIEIMYKAIKENNADVSSCGIIQYYADGSQYEKPICDIKKFYSEKEEGRSFLISESVRGEGAKLYNNSKERFTEELLPRDILTGNIRKEMKREGSEHVWLSMKTIDPEQLKEHFPNIVEHCKEHGYNVPDEMIPVVPAQHYFMGGIKVNLQSKTSMDQLYAIGETACNGVHGRNRLASNSLLESMVFAKRAAKEMTAEFDKTKTKSFDNVDFTPYEDKKKLEKEYKQLIRDEIDKENAKMNDEEKQEN